jgi:diamine N-acetyltransferase
MPPVIEGKRVRLRPLAQDDLPVTLAWRNEASIRKWFFSSQVVTPQQHHDWFEHYLTRDNDFVYIIEEILVLKKAIGQLSIYDIDWDQKQAEFGRFMIGETAALGQGLAKEATRLLVEFAESEWGLEQIYLEVYADNLSAIALYQRCGFFMISSSKGIVRMIRCRPPPSR